MVDFARLGLAVDSTQVEKGTATLHQLTGAAGQASAAAQRLAGASQAEAAGQKVATAAAQAHTAALAAQNTVIRSSMQQRTLMIYQLNDVAVSLASGMNPAMVAMQQGSQILQGGIAPALRTIADLAKSVATRFWPIAVAVGAVTATFAGLAYEINKTSDVQVSTLDVMLAAWGMFADQVAAIVGPIWDWLVEGLQWVWDQMAPILKDMGNGIIRPFAFGVEAIGILWQKLPAAIGDAMITTANVIIKGIEWSINGATRLLNGFLEKYNEGLAAMGQQTIPLASGFTIPQAANPYQGALGELGSGLESANLKANSTDFMGDMFSGLSERAQQIDLARAEVEELGGAATAANDNVKKLADDGLTAAAKAAQEFGDTLKDAFKGFISDLREGKSWTEALGNALSNLGDRFLDLALDAVFGGAGGGGIFGAIAGLFGFAKGGVFNAGQQVQAFANGGVVTKPTMFPMANGAGLMGEAGPEAIMPLKRGPDGRLGVSAANQNQPQQHVHVTVGVAADGNGNLMPFVQGVSQQTVASAAPAIVGTAVNQSNKSAPSAMARYQQQRAGGEYRT